MKKQMKQVLFRGIAVLLSVVMVVVSFPLSVFATENDEQSNEIPFVINEACTEEMEEPSLPIESKAVTKDVFELEDHREESVKHFRLEDGSIMAIQYANAVHKLDENGKWVDINNTLSAKEDEYTTSDNRIHFAKSITDFGTIFTLQENDCKIIISLDGAKKSVSGQVAETNTRFEETTTQLQKLTILDKLSSSIHYTDILDDVDLEYIIVSNDIKENILVKKKKNSYIYTFTIELDNLEANLTEGGSVTLTHPETKATLYVIPAPIVYDANHTYATSKDAFYTLVKKGKNTYSLSVTVNSSWMNDSGRAFPVTVDPTVSISRSSVLDLDFSSSSPSTNYTTSDTMFVSDTWRAYWKTGSSDLPSIPPSAYISEATISLKRFSGSGNYVGVYQVISDWDSTLNWNKTQAANPEGQLSETTLDYNLIANNTGWYSWNITSLIKGWYSGTNNYGIAFAPVASTSAPSVTSFYTNDSNNASDRPRLVIIYKDMKGVEPYWSYSTQTAGIAGTSYINRANGALTLTKGLLSTTDSLFPYTPTIIYTSALVTTENNVTQLHPWSYPYAQTASANFYMPLGFKWNIQETLIKKHYYKSNGDQAVFYIWSDADGTEHYFFAIENSTTEYEDEDGLQLKLVIDYNNAKCTISDDSKTVRTFIQMQINPANEVLESWYLTKITDKSGNEISFTFNNSLQPIEICLTPNGIQAKIIFLKILYNNGLPYLIWNDVSKEAIIFRYSATPTGSIVTSGEQYLRKLIYAHGDANTTETNWLNFYNDSNNTTNITVDGNVAYTYNTSGYLIYARDEISNYRIYYSFQSGKVKTIKEYGQSSNVGQEIRLSYYNGYTEVRVSGTDDVIGDSDDIITRYTFDREGRVASSYSTDYSKTQFYGGTSNTYETESRIKNNIKESAVIGGIATNYLINGGFESIQSTYIANSWTSSSNNVSYVGSSFENGGNYQAYFRVYANTTDSIAQYTQLPAGTYTISMNVNTWNCLNAKAYIIAYSLNQTSNVLFEEIPINEFYATGGPGFFSTTFTAGNYNSNNSENFKIMIQTVGGSSLSSGAVIVSVDNIMLEENIGNSNYSLIQYGNFDKFMINSSGTYLGTGASYWSSDLGNLSYSNAGAPFNYTGKLVGSITDAKYLKQTFYTASSDDIYFYDHDEPYSSSAKTFTVSGFAKGTGQVASANSAFRLRVVVEYYAGNNVYEEGNPITFDFQYDCKDWQFVCGTFTTEDNRLVTSITLYCDYTYQPGGTALFDNISVFQNNYEGLVKYRYYTDNPAIQNDQYYHVEYNTTRAGLVHVKQVGYYMEVYEYNNNRQLVRKANNRGELYEYTYANNGIDISYEVYYKYTYLGTNAIYPYLADDPSSLITKTPQTRTSYSYNSYGQITFTNTYEVIYNSSNILITKPGTKKITALYSYQTTNNSRIFGALLSESDSLSQQTRYYYDSSNGRLLACINVNTGKGICYSYDAIGNITSVRPATYVSSSAYNTVSNAENVSYQYNNYNQLEQISTDTTTYTFSYDVFGNASSVSIGNQQLLASYQYNNNNGKLNTVIYGNGYAEKYVYDNLENVKEVWYTNDYQDVSTVWIRAYEYTYTSYGQLYRFDNLLTGKSIIYKYNTSGKLTDFIEFDAEDNINEYSKSVFYDDVTGNISSLFYDFDYYVYNGNHPIIRNASISYFHSYNPDSSLRHIFILTETTDGEIKYSYDAFKRINSKEINFYNNDTGFQFTNTISYGYTENGDKTAAQLSSYISQVNNNTATTYQYIYDKLGNITQIKDGNDVIQYQYTYDKLSQLIREDNRPMNQTYTYSYDNAGNRTSKSTYAFTTDTQLGTPQSVQSYTYGDSNWGDLLTQYGSTNIEYDEIGNPTFIGQRFSGGDWCGEVMQWEGRNLVSYKCGDQDYQYPRITYTYNDQGIRTSKAIYDEASHQYLLDGSRIIGEVIGYSQESYRLIYLYDEIGSPIGMRYRDPGMAEGVFYTFWFEKNLQGDIIAVYNENGTKIISYTYDAWGDFTYSVSNFTGSNIYATYNPFHYRGYYYDTETGFYYLQSRYYNPSWGRFLNADVAISRLGNLFANMFVYSFNNPIIYSDATGNWPSLSTVFAVVAITAIAVAATAAVIVSCGAAAPAVAIAGGSVVGGISASSLATVAMVEGVALATAEVAAGCSVTSYAVEKVVEKMNEHNNSVYVLKDENGTVQYVGRTCNVEKRKAAHGLNSSRKGLKMEVIASGLTLQESRALEQSGMAYYHTINTANKMNNQINSVSPKFWGTFMIIAKGTLDYGWNQMSNEILYWTGN